MNGLLIVDKPEGLTSAEVVRRAKRRARVKVGHLGTLDPFATGVLPLCLGEATKIAQFLNTADKRYEGTIRLGAATDTGDRTGKVIRTAPVPPFDQERLRRVVDLFVGEYRQTPPMYSALKRAGVPLYKLARRGVEVERPSRVVKIAELSVNVAEPAQLRFEVACSKGTYVRVLAEDIASALGSVAHLEALRRTQFGGFHLAQAVELADWDPSRQVNLVSIRRALSHVPSFVLDEKAARAARAGQAWVLEQVGLKGNAGLGVLIDPSGEVVAVVVREGGRWAFGRVLRDAPPLQDPVPVLTTHTK